MPAKIPEKELIYFLGGNYGKITIPEAVKILKEKGFQIDGSTMTMADLFKLVKKAYAERSEK